MGLGSALVDRARIVRQVSATETRVAGSSVLAQVEGNWFRARLELPGGSESEAPERGRRRQVLAPTLLFEPFDEANEDVDLSADDYVEVDSVELGRTRWQITTFPQPIRKKRAVIGFQVTLRRIANRELERLTA